MGMKGLEVRLGGDKPMLLTANTLISYRTPSIILLASYVVDSYTSKLSFVHLEEPFFFLSMRYPDGVKTQ